MKFFVFFAVLVCAQGLFNVPKLNAAATLQMSLPFVNGVASNFANSAGVATNGMLYGVLVSTNGSTFQPGAYDEMSPATLLNGGFMTIGGIVTDIYFHPGGNPAQPGSGLTYDGTGLLEGDLVTTGSLGTIENVSLVPINPDQPTSPISALDKFALIWFSTNTASAGDYYGLFSHASFVMPALGDVDFSSAFLGTDVIRSANQQFQAIPEPSRMLLIGMGIGGFLLRRRRHNE
ncbi:PEP-CTERM sorting domain-containing protein [Phragmitibacter flavus]|uniref:PEP-CTERM sorting domain-containing protein n=2 Tax=Phragmitibacter flavus TaxID=2576071 RepID=A0A5R8KHN4_9BACT|nr:PEP-CTERM sorting domain-containing protein [Phragmitibacter flavus]